MLLDILALQICNLHLNIDEAGQYDLVGLYRRIFTVVPARDSYFLIVPGFTRLLSGVGLRFAFKVIQLHGLFCFAPCRGLMNTWSGGDCNLRGTKTGTQKPFCLVPYFTAQRLAT